MLTNTSKPPINPIEAPNLTRAAACRLRSVRGSTVTQNSATSLRSVRKPVINAIWSRLVPPFPMFKQLEDLLQTTGRSSNNWQRDKKWDKPDGCKASAR